MKKFLTFIFLLSIALQAYGEQTIFNVPNAEVAPKNVLFLEHESQFRAWEPDFWNGTHYSTFGIGHNSCISATLYNLNSIKNNNMTLGVGFKSVMPIQNLTEQFPEVEPKFTVGSEVLIGLTGNGVGNFTYTTLSARIPKIKTRLT